MLTCALSAQADNKCARWSYVLGYPLHASLCEAFAGLQVAEDRLDGSSRELTRSSERYAVRFQPIVEQWRQIIAEKISMLAAESEARQEIDNPYVIAVPLTTHHPAGNLCRPH